jgi:hypothetical protein
MSLLDNFPHTCTTKRRARAKDSIGGSSDTFATVSTDLPCWQQPASMTEVREYEKRGMTVTNKVYFRTDPGVDSKFVLEVTNPQTGRTDTLEVRSRSRPDASAGLGVVYKVMAELSTTGSTP